MGSVVLGLLVSTIPSAFAEFHNPSEAFLSAVEGSATAGIFSVDYTESAQIKQNGAMVLSGTGNCVFHKNEQSKLQIRSETQCKNFIKDSAQGYTSEINQENIRVGQSLFQRTTTSVVTPTSTPPSPGASAMMDNNTVIQRNLGQWLQFDKSTRDNTLLGPSSTPNTFVDRLLMYQYAEMPFTGWTNKGGNVWTMDNLFTANTWSPLALLLSMMQNTTLSDAAPVKDLLTTVFLANQVHYKGTLTATSDTSGNIDLQGSSDVYKDLQVHIQFGQDGLQTTWTGIPSESAGAAPAINQQINFKGLDAQILLTIAYTDGTTELSYSRTASTKRALENMVAVPADAVHGGETYDPTEYTCPYIQYTDICNHWSKRWIARAVAVNYIGQKKYGDNPEGLLKPDVQIPRSEFAKLIVDSRLLELLPETTTLTAPAYSKNDSFLPSDADASAWYRAPVQELVGLGIAALQDGRRFRPNETLNRAEVMTFLARIIEKSTGKTNMMGDAMSRWNMNHPSALTTYFPDVPTTSWYAQYVALMAESGLLDLSQPNFRPGDPVSRAEAITLLERLREKMPSLLVQ